jgi:ferredoxin
VNVPDCVGCGRYITNCPKEVLSFSDVRNLFKKAPSSVEFDRPEEVNLGEKEIHVQTSKRYKNEDYKPLVIEPFKDDFVIIYQTKV